MKRPERVILRDETRLFLSILLAIVLPVFAAANALAVPFAYITNQNSNNVSVIDTATNTVVATIPVGSGPVGVAVNPSGTRLYVTNRGSGNISVIDTSTNAVVATIPVGSGPVGVAVNPSGTRLYAANFSSNTVSVIDTSTNAVVATIPVGSAPNDVAVNPSGTRLYVVNHLSSTVSVIDASTNTVVITIPVGSVPVGVAVNPSGARVYVTSDFSGKVSVIDTSTNTVFATISVGSRPQGVAVNLFGTRVYAANYGSNTVSVIDTSTNTVFATIPVGSGPIGVAVNPSGTRLYVANNSSNTVSVIDTSTNTVAATIPVGSGPLALGKFIGPEAQCVAPPADLVSWWPGDGNANDIIDGNDGLVNGATFAAGMVGQAFSFDGVNDEVKAPYAVNLNPTQALTLDAWVNMNSLTNTAHGGYQGVVSMSEGQRAYFFGITGTGSNHMGTAGNVHLEGFGLGSAHRTSAAVITPGQWYHIAGVIEPSTHRFEIYVNGVLQPPVSSGGGPQLASVSNVPFRIGFSDPGFPYHFNGLIDEVELFNRALSAQEIQAIFNAGSLGICKEPAETTPPTTTATPSPTPNVNGWNNTNVMVTLNATDNEGGSGVKEIHYAINSGPETVVSGNSASVTISAEGVTTLTYFAKDNAGNTEGAKDLTVQIDKTPPSIMGLRTPGPNAYGWNNTNVLVTASGTDGTSGIDACTSATVSAEGTGQAVTVGCTDKAGNSASVTMSGISIDKTPPTIVGTRTPAPNGNGWNNTDVTVSFACSDNLSGITSCTPPTALTTEGANQSLSGKAVDLAGNSASTTVSGISIDKTPPELVARCAPPGGSPFLTGRDSSSGMASVLLTGSSAIRRGEFKRQETYTILDKAGNRLEASFGVKAEGHETEFTLLSLAYNGGAQLTLPENELKCEWATEKTGTLKELEQKLEIGRAKSEVEVQAKFEGKKNETEIKVKTHGAEPHQRVTRPGLVFLNLTTNQGALGVDY